MLTLILILLIGGAIAGYVAYSNTNSDSWFGCGTICTSVGSLLFLAVVIMLGFICTESRIDNKIAMYEEENTSIETSVVVAVEKYLEHEQVIFDDIKGENLQTLLVVYPEIKADQLITKQIELFIDNNTKIKELKEEKISLGVLRFLVYFGG